MYEKIFENYETFYNMILSSTMLSNCQTAELEQDAKKIIEFIGKAYGLDDAFIEICSDVILNQLSKLARTTDQSAIYSSRGAGMDYTQLDSLFDIKGDILSTIHQLSTKPGPFVSEGWFDYSHYKTYQAEVRFGKIAVAASTGNLISVKQIAIMWALGIGCEQSYEKATVRLLQCVYWGDIPSMYYLGYVYSLMGDDDKSKLYYQLARLCKQYLYTGLTVLPKECESAYCIDTRTLYAYISTIRQDVVYAHKMENIAFSFIEAISSDTLDYYKRMDYINHYERLEWKDVTNSSAKPVLKIGF